MYNFKIISLDKGLNWFFVKESHFVKREGKNWTCTCLGETYKIGGKKQKDCKHILEIRSRLMTFEQEGKNRID